MPSPSKLACAVALALAAAPKIAAAGNLDYTLFGGIEHSNNVNLSAIEPISQTTLVPGLGFDFAQDGSTVQAHANGTVEYRDYLHGRFDNQLLTQLAGAANWEMLPQRLDFVVQDFASVQPLSTLASDAPDNQQQTNVFALGPTLQFNLGQTLQGQAELHYINSHASKTTEFNSSRGQAAVRMTRDLTPTDQLSVNIESQHVTFDDSGTDADYNRQEITGRYVRKLAHFDLDAALGWAQVDFRTRTTVSTPMARARVSWRPSPNTTLAIAGARQYSDAAEEMIGQINQSDGTAPPRYNAAPGINTGGSVVTSQAFLERRLQGYYSFNSERFTLSASPLYRKLHYLNGANLDQTAHGANAEVDFRPRKRLTVSIFANQERVTYQSLARRDSTLNYGIGLVGTSTPHWSWRLSLTQRRRSSTVPQGSYHAGEIYAGVVYQR